MRNRLLKQFEISVKSCTLLAARVLLVGSSIGFVDIRCRGSGHYAWASARI